MLFSSFLTFATAPLASSQSQDQTQDQTTKKTQKGTPQKETGKTADQDAPADQNKAGTTEKSETGKTGVKKGKKTSSLSSERVRQIQMSLKDAGFVPGPVDGIMGAMTKTALRNFQSHNNLQVTGMLNAETEKALLHGASARNQQQSSKQNQQYGENQQTYGKTAGETSQPGTTSEPAASSVSEVKQIQQSLADLGYNPGEVNGMITSQTQDAIRQFQWLNNLPVTGIVDQQTKMALDTQEQGGVENAKLGQEPLSAERAKPNTELQQNQTDKTYQDDKSDYGKHSDEATGKHEKIAADRIAKAAAVLQDLTTSSKDNRIPSELLERAEAVVVIPHMVKGAFGVGGRYGKGVVSERMDNGRWSPPAFMDIGGGSFGFQIGASATDLVLVFTDRKALDMLEKGKDLKLGGDAGIVAGPVGRSAEAGTNAKLESAIYAYSRSKGLFAGVALDGAVLYMDNDMNRKVYGASVDSRQILNGSMASNSTVRPFTDALERSVPRKRIS
jgi:lipid-binding SYLF domain-containing protein/peptidoglycan hydrolase-like protein with peptidoglycan-binding domain